MSTTRTGMITTSVRPVGDLAAQLSASGWHVGVVSGATSLAEALDAIGAALAFPDYYGRNLDALYDCLTDLDAPTALVWTGWEPLAVYAPAQWESVVRVLGQRVEADHLPAFSVVFTVGGDADEAVGASA